MPQIDRDLAEWLYDDTLNFRPEVAEYLMGIETGQIRPQRIPQRNRRHLFWIFAAMALFCVIATMKVRSGADKKEMTLIEAVLIESSNANRPKITEPKPVRVIPPRKKEIKKNPRSFKTAAIRKTSEIRQSF
jgi:hypothetical protein